MSRCLVSPYVSLIFLSLAIAGCGADYGKHLNLKGCDLYYTANVKEPDAVKLGRYLVENEFGEERTVQLDQHNGTYEVRMVFKKGLEADQETITQVRAFCNELSTDVFEGRKVDLHICDENLKTVRVVVVP